MSASSKLNIDDLNPVSIDAKEQDYLFVKTSSIQNAGRGLFTAIKIYPGEIISVFTGKILTDEEVKVHTIAGNDLYFVSMPDGTTMDSANHPCFAKYANDAEGFIRSKRKNNSIITLNDQNKVCLVAITIIQPGKEIFCDYGAHYWKARKERFLH